MSVWVSMPLPHTSLGGCKTELLQLRSRVEIRGALFRGSVVVFRRVSRGAGGWMRRAVGALHCLQVGSLCYLSWIYETSPSRNKLKRLMQKSFHDKRFSSVFIQIFLTEIRFYSPQSPSLINWFRLLHYEMFCICSSRHVIWGKIRKKKRVSLDQASQNQISSLFSFFQIIFM